MQSAEEEVPHATSGPFRRSEKKRGAVRTDETRKWDIRREERSREMETLNAETLTKNQNDKTPSD